MFAVLVLALQTHAPRDVIAPPEDILAGIVRLPDLEACSSVSGAAIESLRFVRTGSGWQAELTAHFDGQGALTLLSPSAARWRVLAAPAGLPPRDLDAGVAQRPQLELAGDFLPGFVSARRELRAESSGPWTVRVIASSASDVDVGWIGRAHV